MKRMMLAVGAALPLALGQAALAQEPREDRYRGSVTHTECRPSSGGTGLAVGGVAGGLVGAGISGGGLLGTLVGIVGGAIAGRAIDRDSTKAKRCRQVREEEPYRTYDDRPAVAEPTDHNGDLYERGPSER
jgi:uncharacterized protein YcfJ